MIKRNTLLLAFAFVAPLLAQKHEIGLTLGGFVPGSRSGVPSGLDLGGGPGFQANYGYRLLDRSKFALFAETHFLANPLRDIASLNRSATRDVATLYVTPGVRLKFAPRSKLSPYLVAGGRVRALRAKLPADRRASEHGAEIHPPGRVRLRRRARRQGLALRQPALGDSRLLFRKPQLQYSDVRRPTQRRSRWRLRAPVSIS